MEDLITFAIAIVLPAAVGWVGFGWPLYKTGTVMLPRISKRKYYRAQLLLATMFWPAVMGFAILNDIYDLVADDD